MVFSPDPVNYTVMFNKFVDKVVYYVLFFQPADSLPMHCLDGSELWFFFQTYSPPMQRLDGQELYLSFHF